MKTLPSKSDSCCVSAELLCFLVFYRSVYVAAPVVTVLKVQHEFSKLKIYAGSGFKYNVVVGARIN